MIKLHLQVKQFSVSIHMCQCLVCLLARALHSSSRLGRLLACQIPCLCGFVAVRPGSASIANHTLPLLRLRTFTFSGRRNARRLVEPLPCAHTPQRAKRLLADKWTACYCYLLQLLLLMLLLTLHCLIIFIIAHHIFFRNS